MKYFVALFLTVASSYVCADQAANQSTGANGAAQVVNGQVVEQNGGDLAGNTQAEDAAKKAAAEVEKTKSKK